MKWDEMSARERDVLVAEKVMEFSSDAIGDWWKDDEGVHYWITGDFLNTAGVWSPSQDMTCAWQVVDRMKSLGWNMDLNNALVQFSGEHWHFVSLKNGKRHVEAWAPTASEAIALVALRAVDAAPKGWANPRGDMTPESPTRATEG